MKKILHGKNPFRNEFVRKKFHLKISRMDIVECYRNEENLTLNGLIYAVDDQGK